MKELKISQLAPGFRYLQTLALNSLCKTLIILALSGCTYCETFESLKRKIKIHLRTIWFDTSLLIKFVLLTGSSFRICNFHVSNENV